MATDRRTDRRIPRLLWFALLVLLAIVGVGLAGFDVALAKSLVRFRGLDPVVDLLELITLKNVSELILPLLVISGGGLLWLRGWQGGGRAAAYIGLVQLITYFASDFSKPLFGRLRPFEMAEQGLVDRWYVAGNSFPSGHVAYFAGLAVPIIVVFPRAWPILAVPAVVATQRVLSTDHYLSDVAASCALAIIVSMALIRIAHRKRV